MRDVTYTTLIVIYTLIWCGKIFSLDDGGVEWPTMGNTCRCKIPQDINECCCKDVDGDPCCTTECSLPGHQGSI